jgi:hypothetical protein
MKVLAEATEMNGLKFGNHIWTTNHKQQRQPTRVWRNRGITVQLYFLLLIKFLTA